MLLLALCCYLQRESLHSSSSSNDNLPFTHTHYFEATNLTSSMSSLAASNVSAFKTSCLSSRERLAEIRPLHCFPIDHLSESVFFFNKTRRVLGCKVLFSLTLFRRRLSFCKTRAFKQKWHQDSSGTSVKEV